MLYPFKFNHIYIEKIWGGRDLLLYHENIPDDNIGESFDVSCFKDNESVVTNGEYVGITLSDLIDQFGQDIVGNKVSLDDFPIMLRLVNPREKLSVQVHPTDEYAKLKGMQCGKLEAWYVMETFENPYLYYGTHDCTLEEFKQAVVDDTVEKYLTHYTVKKGDVFLIPCGMVHAMGHDLVMLEIGQNSNTTYRIHDYGRGRPLDIEDALNVVNINQEGGLKKPITIQENGYERNIYFSNEKFAWERLDIDSELNTTSDLERFCVYTCVKGNCIIKYANNKREYLKCGESILIPSCLGDYKIQGEVQLLKSYVPDMNAINS